MKSRHGCPRESPDAKAIRAVDRNPTLWYHLHSDIHPWFAFTVVSDLRQSYGGRRVKVKGDRDSRHPESGRLFRCSWSARVLTQRFPWSSRNWQVFQPGNSGSGGPEASSLDRFRPNPSREYLPISRLKKALWEIGVTVLLIVASLGFLLSLRHVLSECPCSPVNSQ